MPLITICCKNYTFVFLYNKLHIIPIGGLIGWCGEVGDHSFPVLKTEGLDQQKVVDISINKNTCK